MFNRYTGTVVRHTNLVPSSLSLCVTRAQMVSLVSRERWVRVDRRERPVALAPRDPLGHPDLT